MSSPNSSPPVSAPDALPPLRSVHTTSFADILQHYGISVLVTTYQAGKLVVLRADRGVVNTHFRGFVKPMGLAVQFRINSAFCSAPCTPRVRLFTEKRTRR
jgi:hypothetical protein